MKRTFCILFSCALLTAQLPSAAAEAPKIAEIYASADVQASDSENTGTTFSATVRYVFEDGTYKELSIRDSESRETARPAGEAEPENPGFVRIYPQEEESVSDPTTPAPQDESAALTYDEGVDTEITISGYTPYSGEGAPGFLTAGDKVAVISPSALSDQEQAEATAEGLRAWGYEPVLGNYAYAEQRTMEECMEDLRWALEDPEIKAIFCIRGGYGATEVMDALTDDVIAAAKKPIIGYSDITAYHAGWTCAGVPSVHASMSAAFSDFPEACAEAEQRMLRGEVPTYQCASDALCRTGTAEGILVGGNLSTFAALLDSDYDSTKLDQPYILFLEEVGENMQHIHRYLTILKHSGVLDRAAGVVFGEWTVLPSDGMGNYGAARGGKFASVADMITRQFLADVKIPVAFGFPAGHGESNYPLLMGAPVKLDVTEESYTLSWQ